MKSAFELALERTGGALSDVSEDKKKLISEIDSKYKAKIAEAELAFREKIERNQGNIIELDQIKDDYAVETASIKSKCEKEKEKIRLK